MLISENVSFFATVVGKVYMSDWRYYWCNLSIKERYDESHGKGMLWTINLMKKLYNNQILHKKMTSYEEKIVSNIII